MSDVFKAYEQLIEPHKPELANFTRSVKGQLIYSGGEQDAKGKFILSVSWKTNGIDRGLMILVPPHSTEAEFVCFAYQRKDGKDLSSHSVIPHTLGPTADFKRALAEARTVAESFREDSFVIEPQASPITRFVRSFMRSPSKALMGQYLWWRVRYIEWRNTRQEKAIAEHRPRQIYFKLPLKQTEFHWRFTDRSAFLSGALSLNVTRDDGTAQSIPVFARGALSEGWNDMESDSRKPSNSMIYFGFQSTKTFLMSNKDTVTIELDLVQDASGIGPSCKGILKAGRYSTSTTVVIYKADGRAFLSEKRCHPQWDLEVTDSHGWMDEQKQDS